MSSLDFLEKIQSTMHAPNFIFISASPKQEVYLKRFHSSWIQVLVEYKKNNMGEILDAEIITEDKAKNKISKAILQGKIKFSLQ